MPEADRDELSEIDGIKPKIVIPDGEEVEAKSHTSNSVYKVKRAWDHYYCTCPAWRNQARMPVNARTCKHLRSILGDEYEEARLKLKNPDGPVPAAGKPKKERKGKRKKTADSDDEQSKTSKKSKTAVETKKRQQDEEEEVEEEVTPSRIEKPNVLLAVKWDLEKGPDPTGWWISEKLDGVRVFYDGKKLLSRLGNSFTPPAWFMEGLPKDITLDGELFGGRGKFNDTVSIVKTVNSPHWKNITLQLFDVPSLGSKPFEDRVEFLQSLFGPSGSHRLDHVVVLEQTLARSREHVLEKFREVEGLKGEGLMLRKPGSKYEHGRSSTLQKIKRFHDAEAKVIEHVKGKGKNLGLLGALKCVMASGKTFSVGTGFNDKQRQNPPKIGTIVTYKFQELTPTGVPRFPVYVGEALDKEEPTDAQVLDTDKTG